jgi:hypothetical protein
MGNLPDPSAIPKRNPLYGAFLQELKGARECAVSKIPESPYHPRFFLESN